MEEENNNQEISDEELDRMIAKEEAKSQAEVEEAEQRELEGLYDKLHSMDAKEGVNTLKSVIDHQVSQRIGIEKTLEAINEFFADADPETRQKFENNPKYVQKAIKHVQDMSPQERQKKGKQAIMEALNKVVIEMTPEELENLTRKKIEGQW